MSQPSGVIFGPRLRELREAAGLTQGQLAERAGLHVQGVVKLERGEREPAWATVVALANALGVTCQEFLQVAEDTSKRPRGRPRQEDEESPTPDKKGKAKGK